MTFNNLIRRWRSGDTTLDPDPGNWVVMSPLDLMSITQFQPANGRAIFNTHRDPAWLLVAAGCANDGFAVVLQGSIDDARQMLFHYAPSREVEAWMLIWVEQ